MRESSLLLSRFNQCACAIGSPLSAEQLACEMVVVRLYDAWARFCRELVIVSACGNATTRSGDLLSPAPKIRGRASVIPTLIATYPKRRYEPKWAIASECIDAAQRLKVVNLATISAALGCVSSPAKEIQTIRNFFAHRGDTTARLASDSGRFGAPGRPRVWGLNSYTPGGRTVMESWVEELSVVAVAAIQ